MRILATIFAVTWGPLIPLQHDCAKVLCTLMLSSCLKHQVSLWIQELACKNTGFIASFNIRLEKPVNKCSLIWSWLVLLLCDSCSNIARMWSGMGPASFNFWNLRALPLSLSSPSSSETSCWSCCVSASPTAALHFSHLSFKFSLLGASSSSFFSFVSFVSFFSFCFCRVEAAFGFPFALAFALLLAFAFGFLGVFSFTSSFSVFSGYSSLSSVLLSSCVPSLSKEALGLLKVDLVAVIDIATTLVCVNSSNAKLWWTNCLLCRKIAVKGIPWVYAVGVCKCVCVCCAQLAIFVETQSIKSGIIHSLPILINKITTSNCHKVRML